MPSAQILVVDDEPDIRATVKDILEDEGYSVGVAEHATAARAARRGKSHDLILLDVWMPDADGISLLREWNEQGALDNPVVMMSGHGTVETAVQATRLGAYDFIEKPISLAKLLLTVERALEAKTLRNENAGLKKRAPGFPEPIGNSRVMHDVRALAERVAAHDAWVLIRGEPGTGKETLARYVHAKSPRREAPFVELAPGALVRAHATAELFGSEENGQLRYGLIERANGGTLFIDEVADLDPELQLRLTTALTRKQVQRLGGSQPVPVDVRVIASTSRELDAELRAGRFREELYFQLQVVPITVPPLRDRPDDTLELLRHFAETLPARDRLPYRSFSIAAQNRLRQHSWPGNGRELANLVQRLLILGSTPEVDLAEVEQALGPARPAERAAAAGPGIAVDPNQPLREAREQFEREYLLHQLKLAGGSVGKLAKTVGLERTHLYRKLRALGVELKEGDG